MICPYCKKKMKEVSREEDYEHIQIVYDCKCGRSPSAISPILGTLLLLVLCVALAVIVAAIALNMGSAVPQPRFVSFTAHQEGDTIYVTYHGGPNQLDVADGGIIALVNELPATTPFPKTGRVEVGTSAKATGTPGRDHVVVITTFIDGKKSVSLDTYV